MARKKANTEEVIEEVEVTEVEEPEVVTETIIIEEEPVAEKPKTSTTKKTTKKSSSSTAEAKQYDAEDLIPCRSITQGRLLMTGPRSGILYVWYSVGDVVEVEYQDLTALVLSRSKYLTSPLFVVEDEDLLEQPRWKDIKALYSKLIDVEDFDTILNLPPAQLKKTLQSLPKTVLKTLAVEVSTRIENGTYDSINRIKIFDEVCGTDMMCLVG